MVDTQFYINKGPFSLRQIAEICEAELADSGKADVVIKDIATMAKAGAEEICFFYDKKAKGIGVFTVDGKMIDIAFYDGAKRTIELAKASGVYKGDL